MNKYFGDKNFYRRVLAVAVPIMIQNGITNFVNMLDNIMVGQLGTDPISGVAIINQLMFVFNLCLFGALSGIGIFTAQYYGKGDHKGVRYNRRGERTSNGNSRGYSYRRQRDRRFNGKLQTERRGLRDTLHSADRSGSRIGIRSKDRRRLRRVASYFSIMEV